MTLYNPADMSRRNDQYDCAHQRFSRNAPSANKEQTPHPLHQHTERTHRVAANERTSGPLRLDTERSLEIWETKTLNLTPHLLFLLYWLMSVLTMVVIFKLAIEVTTIYFYGIKYYVVRAKGW
ncbi:hypothetical protein EDB82DRAFT_535003 [Fusarium venenatum]|uniref:uncharacterized protein n=1 Tax=Fusarium venenatum TaxID=56646 RepID=UPI001DA7C3AB|nr:hypothetical protein EDB82DRAFT_535003 [Fusarium venenatum]